MEIYTIIPATKVDSDDSSNGDKNGGRIRNPIPAPIGSANPAQNEY